MTPRHLNQASAARSARLLLLPWLGAIGLVSSFAGCAVAKVVPPSDAGVTFDAGTNTDASVDQDLGMDASPPNDSGSSGDAGSDLGIDAGGEYCPNPGDTRPTTSCGLCGSGTESCTADHRWQLSSCTNSGDCMPGTSETRTTNACGQEQRTCSATCQWSSWSRTIADQAAPTCQYGSWTYSSLAGCGDITPLTYCNTACEWEAPTQCVGQPCPGTPRTSPAYAEEVCVAGGLFEKSCGFPTRCVYPDLYVHTYLQPFYIDRYPVTWRRYQACVDAGVCTPVDTNATYMGALIQDANHPDSAVWSASYEQAATFCAWDGGRRLPSSFEWEKAGRGPYPRIWANPWANDNGACNALAVNLYFTPCNAAVPSISSMRLYDQYDSLPYARSIYGVDDFLVNFREWTRTYMTPQNFRYSTAATLVNPEGPATGTTRITKGSTRQGYIEMLHQDFDDVTLASFRCSRVP